ncbi:MAG: hypothetical protein FD175_1313 [Beijerinckiaceae bacterium]|nr:MAG: hypothetical protein FD175_1313 [Beijerinckiaceae bacterium]
MLQRNRLQEGEVQAHPRKIDYPQPALEIGTRQWIVVGLLLLACSLALTWPWLSGRVTIPWDAKAHFHAQVAFLAQSIHSGQSPFWAPYVFGGHPQIADPQAMIFSPPYLLLAFLTPNPTFAMVDGVAFASLVFGALGILGFARDRRWHPAAALVAALAFAFGSSAAWRIQHIGQIESLTFFPWALWMLERSLRLHSARYGALSGLFAGLVVLGPDQVAFLILVTLAAFVIVHWLTGEARWQRIRSTVRPLAAGALVGSAIIALPTLMVLSFADGSNRAHIDLEEAYLGSLHPSSLITFVVSNIFGTIGPPDDYWGAPSKHWPYIVYTYVARNMAIFYTGILPVIGIITWLCRREAYSRRLVVLSILFALMIAYALGRYTPVFAALYHILPGADLFRRPADSVFIVGALGAVLAGFGLNAILQRGEQRLPLLADRALTGALVVPVLAGIGMAIWLGKLGQATPEIIVAMITISVSFAALAYAVRHARSRPMQATLVLALCLTGDFAWNIRPNHSTALPPEDYTFMQPDKPNETLDYLKSNVVQDATRRDRVELAGLGFDWPNVSLIHKLENTLGYNPLRVAHYGAAVGARDHVAGWDQRKFSAMMPGYRSPFANLLGLRYIATNVPIERIDPALVQNPLPLVARTKDTYIYENPDALPRVMIVPEAQAVDQDALVKSGIWPSTDFRRTVFVEPSAIPLPRRSLGGTAKITNYSNTTVEIEVSAQRSGVLLLNDVWHPWWFAEVDGMPAKILRANGVFRAVVLPQGAKKVVFRFEPIRGLVRRYLLKRGLIQGDGTPPA